VKRASPRRDVDDPPAIADERKELLGQEENALEVDVVQGVQILLGRLVEWLVVRNACIVDEVVEALCAKLAQRLSHPLHERIEASDVTRVELQGDGPAPHVSRQVDDFLGFSPIRVVGEDRIDPTPSEAQYGNAPEAATAPRDDGDPGIRTDRILDRHCMLL
jgi:hypothetical protein